MRHGRALVLLAAAAWLLAGCSSRSVQFSGGQTNSVPATLSMTDTPPAGVSVLSFQVTLTAATLNPGNVQLITVPTTVEVTRLQTESSLLPAANIPPGTYTSLALTIAPNPSLTFQNNTGATLTVGGSRFQ
jgi:predicted component of type VI protein secretion system